MSKTFDFTYFYTDQEDKERELDRWKQFDLRRVVIGDELTKEGKPHFQGKVTWARSYRLPQLTKLLPKYHIEVSLCAKDFNYCLKENIILNRNEAKQGARSDLRGAMEMVRTKKTRLELMEEHPTVVARYEPFLDAYRAELNAFNGERCVIWVYGETGSGKSRTIRDIIPDAVSVSIKNGFVQGYRGEPYVILDDFRAHDLPFSELLKILDRYPYTANIKGGSINWNARLIYITSCYAPHDVYTTSESVQQLLRRLTYVYKFPADKDECSTCLGTFINGLAQGPAEGEPGDTG